MTRLRIRILVILLTAILLTSSLGITLQSVSALQRVENTDNRLTVRFKQGVICGDHKCGPGEWQKMLKEQKEKMAEKKAAIKEIEKGAAPQAPAPQAPAAQAPTPKASTLKASAPTAEAGSVLKLSNANLPLVIPLVKGLYDGKDMFYISTEASDSDVANILTKFTNFPVTFAPALAKTPAAALAQIFVFKNGVKGSGVLGFQPNVVDSIPGESKYSPLWKVNFVEWKDPAKATVLGSDDDISDAASKGMVTITPANVVVNCPIIQWEGDKEGTVPAGHMQIRQDTTLTDDTPYGGGQVLSIDTEKMQVTFVAHRGFSGDGSTIYYIVTDTVMADPAKMMGVILANKTQAALTSSASSDLFQFGNGIKGTGPMGFQAGIGSTKLGDQFYSPLWRISMISWNTPSSATVLETNQDITSHGDQIKVTAMGMIVNCPFINADTVFAHMK